MSRPPIEITLEALRIDVSGPDWLVDFGWWLKEGSATTALDLYSIGEALVSGVSDVWCLSAAFFVITIARVACRRLGLEVDMVRYLSAHGEIKVDGTANPTIE
ncbi:hypothetical protein [Halorubrum sp. T3]|uniref:hypothetical protein n=1 Tax=Halorubrum sp. T3 TaxID=1194088 RepID=UPI00035FF6C0|nr:hypothetical protein [Halorubrum sp. T3]